MFPQPYYYNSRYPHLTLIEKYLRENQKFSWILEVNVITILQNNSRYPHLYIN